MRRSARGQDEAAKTTHQDGCRNPPLLLLLDRSHLRHRLADHLLGDLELLERVVDRLDELRARLLRPLNEPDEARHEVRRKGLGRSFGFGLRGGGGSARGRRDGVGGEGELGFGDGGDEECLRLEGARIEAELSVCKGEVS